MIKITEDMIDQVVERSELTAEQQLEFRAELLDFLKVHAIKEDDLAFTLKIKSYVCVVPEIWWDAAKALGDMAVAVCFAPKSPILGGYQFAKGIGDLIRAMKESIHKLDPIEVRIYHTVCTLCENKVEELPSRANVIERLKSLTGEEIEKALDRMVYEKKVLVRTADDKYRLNLLIK